MIGIPILIIFLGMLFPMLALLIFLSVKDLVPIWFLPIIFFAGLLLIILACWVLWSVRITDWKLWAFENVRNVHELEKRAIQERIIYEPNNSFSKTEFWTNEKKAKWEIIKEKFKQEDIFIDDLTVPSETLIFYSKSKSKGEITLVIFFLLVGIVLSIVADNYFAAYLVGVFAIFGVYIVYTRYQRTTNIEPQIIINEKGIETISTPFQDWNVIKNEEAIMERDGKHSKSYLIFDFPEGKEHLRIYDFDTSLKSLNHLLRIYRGRSSFRSRTFK